MSWKSALVKKVLPREAGSPCQKQCLYQGLPDSVQAESFYQVVFFIQRAEDINAVADDIQKDIE